MGSKIQIGRAAGWLACGAILAQLLGYAPPSWGLPVSSAPPQASARLALGIIQAWRLQGCAGSSGIPLPLQHPRTLDAAAARWADGEPLEIAIEASGYRAERSVALQYRGSAMGLHQAILQRLCRSLTQAQFRDVGLWAMGDQVWILLATPFRAPQPAAASTVTAQLLARINAARAQPRRCGSHWYPRVAPLQPDARLSRAAEGHAQDMLEHDFFDHRGSDGSSPATRVVAAGYPYRMVGENIAEGAETVAQAVRGWLASPGHCENIMDAGYRQTGAAFAVNRRGAPRIYWVQDFGAPDR